jgi:hypothetical protein
MRKLTKNIKENFSGLKELHLIKFNTTKVHDSYILDIYDTGSIKERKQHNLEKSTISLSDFSFLTTDLISS